MDGKRYYTFKKGDVEFFVVDSTYMSTEQVKWVEKALAESNAQWKIAYMHHPIYSSGKRHGSEVALRAFIEPLFVKYGVSVVLAGHEHFYERLKPQHGIAYFTSGAAGKLREGNIRRGPFFEAGFDTDLSFMLFEQIGDDLHFQVISRLADDRGQRRRQAARSCRATHRDATPAASSSSPAAPRASGAGAWRCSPAPARTSCSARTSRTGGAELAAAVTARGPGTCGVRAVRRRRCRGVDGVRHGDGDPARTARLPGEQRRLASAAQAHRRLHARRVRGADARSTSPACSPGAARRCRSCASRAAAS